jgi:hypothetical protein
VTDVTFVAKIGMPRYTIVKNLKYHIYENLSGGSGFVPCAWLGERAGARRTDTHARTNVHTNMVRSLVAIYCANALTNWVYHGTDRK